ncbi:chromosome partition protein Smc-like [Physella acuta]|uniref:chromosome partition protein Smc-like n=1 Tax=Physella acuta TaxID=109671 RepID=UPI0027DCCAAE|nr:chromosome partition protein Smc-like [Physella acuta]
MPTRIQVKLVTEHKKYLEEQIQVLEPVLGNIKNVVTKSKAWLEEKTDQSSVSYIELSQELDTAATALLDVTSYILSENEELVDVDGRTPSLAQSTLEPTKTETPDQSESTNQVTKLVENQEEVFTRLGLLESSISCLQSSIQKTKEDTSEINQWRNNFVTEKNDMELKIEQLTKKQKLNFKNLRKQISEQDNKVKELNKEIESLKEKESKSNKTLEKLSLDMKEYENNLLKISKEMQDHADTTESITQEIKRHSDQMSTLQEESYKIKLNTSTQIEKHSLMYKLLQQRLMPIDKLIQIFNQNLETREKRITKLENIEDAISKLSKDLNLIESRVCNRYACYVQLDEHTPVSHGSIISTFYEVREYNGQHFNQTTGKFVSPHDGLYLVCVTLNEREDKQIIVGVRARDEWFTTIEVKCANTSAAESVVVDMKKGQELYLKVFYADKGAALSCYNSFTIVSL